MLVSSDERIGGDAPMPSAIYRTDFEMPSSITFTMPPPSLTLVEHTQRAIAEFDAVLDSELDTRYQPMWKELQALVSQLAEQAAQQQCWSWRVLRAKGKSPWDRRS